MAGVDLPRWLRFRSTDCPLQGLALPGHYVEGSEMKPKDVLAAKSSGTGVLVSGILDDQICVIGASLAMSVRPGDYARSFMIYLPDDVEFGVIALAVSSHRFNKKGNTGYSSYPSFPFLLAVRRSPRGETLVDLEEQWVPSQPAQVYGSCLEVQIGDERFSTEKQYEKGNSRQIRYVPDANLLCRYLVDKATADEVRAAAEEAVAEMSRQERIAELEAQVKRLEAGAQGSLVVIRARDATIEQMRTRAQKLDDDLLDALGARNEWRGYVERLRRLLSGRWFLRKDLRQALREFPEAKKSSKLGEHAEETSR